MPYGTKSFEKKIRLQKDFHCKNCLLNTKKKFLSLKKTRKFSLSCVPMNKSNFKTNFIFGHSEFCRIFAFHIRIYKNSKKKKLFHCFLLSVYNERIPRFFFSFLFFLFVFCLSQNEKKEWNFFFKIPTAQVCSNFFGKGNNVP